MRACSVTELLYIAGVLSCCLLVAWPADLHALLAPLRIVPKCKQMVTLCIAVTAEPAGQEHCRLAVLILFDVSGRKVHQKVAGGAHTLCNI